MTLFGGTFGDPVEGWFFVVTNVRGWSYSVGLRSRWPFVSVSRCRT